MSARSPTICGEDPSPLDWICENWQRPDTGIWEMRNREPHFVYSKVMNWVALDRGQRLADKRALRPIARSGSTSAIGIYERR